MSGARDPDYRRNPAPGTAWRMGMAQAQMVLADELQQWLDANDAGLECEHGNLPHRPQRKVKCGCFQAARNLAKS